MEPLSFTDQGIKDVMDLYEILEPASEGVEVLDLSNNYIR